MNRCGDYFGIEWFSVFRFGGDLNVIQICFGKPIYHIARV